MNITFEDWSRDLQYLETPPLGLSQASICLVNMGGVNIILYTWCKANLKKFLKKFVSFFVLGFEPKASCHNVTLNHWATGLNIWQHRNPKYCRMCIFHLHYLSPFIFWFGHFLLISYLVSFIFCLSHVISCLSHLSLISYCLLMLYHIIFHFIHILSIFM
jgi:hypothetical protein